MNTTLELSKILELIQQDNFVEASRLVNEGLKGHPNHPEILFLAGVIAKKQSDLTAAVQFFQQSLQANNKQSQVFNHLGIALKHLGQIGQAEIEFRNAIKCGGIPDDAIKNLALMFMEQKQYKKARELFVRFKSVLAKNNVLKKMLGDVYKHQNEMSKAIKIYQQVLVREPNFINARHNLGVCLKQEKRYSEAIACFQSVLKQNPNVYQAEFNLAGIYVSLGRLKHAEKMYINILSKHPEYVDAHQCLNELYWQLGREAELGNSYQQAMREFPLNVSLKSACAELMMSAGYFGRAEKIVDEGLANFQNKALFRLKGKLIANKNDFKSASYYLHRSLDVEFMTDTALELIQVEISRGEYSKAMELCAQVEEHQPENQLNWALRGTIWRQTGDPRYQWLNNYNAFIKSYTLPTPEGFSSLREFLDKLASVLYGLHQFTQEPLQQTLKNGSQIPGGLFETGDRFIQLLVVAIKNILNQYIQELPDDRSHPLLSRKERPYHIAGSWSVKLNDQGFHVNHVHPQGWISCCAYIEVPDSIAKQEQPLENAGCIKFGESNLNLGEKDQPEMVLVPRSGMLAVFPSYMWHGTVPFDSENSGFRLTTPFDVGN